jgi:hypothetical protein
VQTLTGVTKYNFSDVEGLEISNYGWIIIANCRLRRKLFVLYLTAESSSHKLQLLVKLRVKEAYVFHVLLATIIIR